MKTTGLVLVMVCGIALQGCKSSRSAPPLTTSNSGSDSHEVRPPTPSNDTSAGSPSRVIARVAGRPITLAQVEQPLIEGYGLNLLLNLVQLDVAKQEAARANVSVSPQNIEAERDLTLAKLFQDADKAEYNQLFDQFLEQQHISKPEFDIVLQTNAYLRKIAEPMVKDKITDASLEEAFRQLYGETIQIRHIQLTNMQEVLEAKRRLAAGEAFEKIAQEMSRNARTAGLGGELPPFSRQAAGCPQAFKDAAFSLKGGEVSDAVQAEGAFHLIKLEHRFPPKAVKFEDVKESLREDLLERLVQAAIKQLRTQIAADALKGLIVDDPMLKAQLDAKLHQKESQIQDRNKIREQFERERQRILARAATQPATLPTTAPATHTATKAPTAPTAPVLTPAAPPPAPEVARPPATQSGGSSRSPDTSPATVPSAATGPAK